MRQRLLVIGYWILVVSFSIWSFTQTDPNLYYSSTSLWVQFQQLMWSIPRVTATWWYVGNVILAFAVYIYLAKTILRPSGDYTGVLRMTKRTLFLLVVGCWLLVISNNALSHDIYNYMFNAKAVATYHQDPHVLSALEIAPADEWLRFMHNVHTPAPYGHFWTYFSLIPYHMGAGKFLTTYLSFKLFMAFGIGLLAYAQWKLLDQKEKIFLFLLNPLILIETFLNGHNDVWMMALALGSFYLLFQKKKILSLVLLLLSTQIKEASVLLIPVWAILAIDKKNYPSTTWITRLLRMTNDYWADIAAISLFLPLLSARSQQFNPWYLIWSLSFLPMMRSKFLKVFLLTFSFTSLLRYVPFLFANGYTDAIQWQMRVITWTAIPVAFCFYAIQTLMTKRK